MRIGVTGTTGFVGRRFMAIRAEGLEKRSLDLRGKSFTELPLQELDAIVHLAGKAHEMQPIPEWIYVKVNFELTRDLADAAMAAGVKQFIYISSTKVYGDEVNEVLTEFSDCHPADPYGKSKRQAEEYLLSIARPEFKVAILRPPLIYGPGVKGNMIRLMDLAAKDLPLPLGNAGNRRSMVYLDNLVALIHQVIQQEAEGIFVGGDAAPISTDALIRMIRQGMGKRPNLFTLPGGLRKIIRSARPALYQRLFGSFEVDPGFTNRTLSFTPPYPTKEGMAAMVNWYQSLPRP
jgi:UDP-glucose 4-epimerase